MIVLVKPSAAAADSVTAFQNAYAAAYPDASGDIYTGETYDADKVSWCMQWKVLQ